ncbi:hypothetical protein LSTR_LSTR013895 [Laodelphax striatellus]|uniref:Carboxylesterase type B domain-containing protein n=1 Tax=Laodelphax striatellus TaxID=195883 RepID=A0A482WSU0_LAOST|nr:hypothetical protein LSTR_LSTR013895 [Laodelphax striatellus]
MAGTWTEYVRRFMKKPHGNIGFVQTIYLFQQAILMSGTADCPWAVSKPHQNGNLTAKMANFVNCSVDDSTTELLECLRKVDATEFLKHNKKFQTVWNGSFVPIVIFRPVLESSFDNSFMTYEAHRAPAPKPMMIGVTSAEGALVLEPVDGSSVDTHQPGAKPTPAAVAEVDCRKQVEISIATFNYLNAEPEYPGLFTGTLLQDKLPIIPPRNLAPLLNQFIAASVPVIM